jgi:hypothetical protein
MKLHKRRVAGSIHSVGTCYAGFSFHQLEFRSREGELDRIYLWGNTDLFYLCLTLQYFYGIGCVTGVL